MSDANGAPRMVTVKCEKHGLRYNPNLHSGCVRCRREAGEPIGSPAAGAPAAGAPAAGVPAAGVPAAGVPAAGAPAAGGSVIPALAVAALLVVATGAGFYFVHRQWYDNFGSFLDEETYGEEYYGDDGYGGEELDLPEEMKLTPEEREQLEELRDELEKRMREGSGG